MTFHTRLTGGVTKYIRCNLQFVNTHRLNFVPKCDFSYFDSCVCEKPFSAHRLFNTWCRATLTEDRLCVLAMLHVHRNDTIGQVKLEAILKRRDSSGNRKIHLAFTDYVLSFEIIH